MLVFADVLEKDGTPYVADMRAKLKSYLDRLYQKDGYVCNAANEIEGFLFKGRDAERRYYETGSFEFPSTGGYYHSLPGDALRLFIDTAAEVQRAMGFANEKDHPEVAPSQFEMNYSYTEASVAADQVLLYKLICRQVAARFDMTASFLPKPVTGVNGSGMHTNLSVSQKGKNLFWDPKRPRQAQQARLEVHRPDPHQRAGHLPARSIPASMPIAGSTRTSRRPTRSRPRAVDRGSMIRIPIGNEKSARIEVRSIAPDANPYLAIYTMFRTGFEGPIEKDNGEKRRDRTKFLPDNIYDAIRLFKGSKYVADLLGDAVHKRYADLKLASAERCPKALGALIKIPEIQFHHEVTNQYLWSKF